MMAPRDLCFLLLALVTWSSDAVVDDEYYCAAVFEHAQVGDRSTDSLEAIIQKNLDIYKLATETAVKKGADIIVFPDYGLFPKAQSREDHRPILECIPPPNEDEPHIPCEQTELFHNRTIMTALSCLARDNNITVVAGMGGIEPCSSEDDPKCPSDGAYHLNSQVAFDRKGHLVARYYKNHLFYEVGYDIPPVSQQSVFRTDFGKVAILSSFDILFKESVDVVEDQQVENVAFPVMWFDEVPYFTSVQVQEMFAVRMGVNLLAAGRNAPHRESLGSGIYSCGKGAAKYTYDPDSTSKLLISKIPRMPNRPVVSEQPPTFILEDGKFVEQQKDGSKVPDVCSAKVLGKNDLEYRCNEADLGKHSLVKLQNSKGSVKICNNGTCCSLDYETTGDDLKEDYYLAAYRGFITIGVKYQLAAEQCLVVRCDPVEGKECSTFPLKSSTVFKSLALHGNFHTTHTPYIFPSVMSSGQRLVSKEKWNFDLDQGQVSLTLEETSEPLLVASLFGRCYENDPPYTP